jgi:hypothetical protein
MSEQTKRPYGSKARPKEARGWAIVSPDFKIDADGVGKTRSQLAIELREGERLVRVKITPIP